MIDNEFLHLLIEPTDGGGNISLVTEAYYRALVTLGCVIKSNPFCKGENVAMGMGTGLMSIKVVLTGSFSIHFFWDGSINCFDMRTSIFKKETCRSLEKIPLQVFE